MVLKLVQKALQLHSLQETVEHQGRPRRLVQLRWQQAGQQEDAFDAVPTGKGSVTLPVGVVSFDSSVIGLGFVVFCSGRPFGW